MGFVVDCFSICYLPFKYFPSLLLFLLLSFFLFLFFSLSLFSAAFFQSTILSLLTNRLTQTPALAFWALSPFVRRTFVVDFLLFSYIERVTIATASLWLRTANKCVCVCVSVSVICYAWTDFPLENVSRFFLLIFIRSSPFVVLSMHWQRTPPASIWRTPNTNSGFMYLNELIE